ncbi:hypothetical protein I546_0743 [Mycobacterium kansasii 732]|nr:hypothetical protein I546_0743 [Mycobacterium kansasii 732]
MAGLSARTSDDSTQCASVSTQCVGRSATDSGNKPGLSNGQAVTSGKRSVE